MKVLLHQILPMLPEHGAAQQRIIALRKALEKEGVQAEFFRWYDSTQQADVLQFFGRIPAGFVRLAHDKKIRVVFADYLAEAARVSALGKQIRATSIRLAKKVLPYQITINFDWDSYRMTDACVLSSPEEKIFVRDVFNASPEKLHIVPGISSAVPPKDAVQTISVVQSDVGEIARGLKKIYEDLLSTSR